ncbi:hypothetical protein BCR32DRAFT_327578 [Anaeromyces robustus]|uniref:NlpC/P60 domain-containing protein n=1 Tax=Anaeromyces robustus TaxID=1754192 RepID=A0A1Y1X4L6_9FUNG|nr:hypothetical protein BCR32DRAFT_327578 [Anaeromyces robustus]|eukprot:ORX80761.1 hypothetical protein BCR32DRAFT_327578 [Anaeromyces robustus]
MRFNFKLLSILLAAPAAFGYIDQPCNAGNYGKGVCVKKSECTMYRNQKGSVTAYTGYAPNWPCPNDPDDVICCVKTVSRLINGKNVSSISGVKSGTTSGRCLNTSNCSGIKVTTPECPGSNRVMLCVDKATGGGGGGGSTLGQQIVNYGRQFIGNPYVYGGNDLNNGVDCSGFTQQVYKHFGYNIPRIANDQSWYGKAVNGVSNAQPGDLFFYCSNGNAYHVTMYTGNGRVVHAADERQGIKEQNNWETPCRIRRII